MKRGRKSSASNVVSIAVFGQRPTLTASRPLNRQEKEIFALVDREHQHLRRLDSPLVTLYAIAVAKTLTSKNIETFEIYARISGSLATKLRLTPQAGMSSMTAGRRYQGPPASMNKPWDGQEDEGA
jgi:hypothetical protein